MNIQRLEAILDQMRAADFADLDAAKASVRQWAVTIDEAISDKLMEDLGITFDADAET
jgi:hypothetical protein